jgi:hypothetical protein
MMRGRNLKLSTVMSISMICGVRANSRHAFEVFLELVDRDVLL